MQTRRKRPVPVYLLMIALLIQGVSGVAGGIGLVADPSGGALGIPRAWLQGSPFGDYLIPGLVLLVLLGLFPLVVVHALGRRRSWSRNAALLVGLMLVVWIVVEIVIIGYHSRPPLQLIYGLLGVVILTLVVLPSVRRHLEA